MSTLGMLERLKRAMLLSSLSKLFKMRLAAVMDDRIANQRQRVVGYEFTSTTHYQKCLPLQLLLQHLIHFRRIGFALHFFHHLADKKPKHFVFAAAVLFDLA